MSIRITNEADVTDGGQKVMNERDQQTDLHIQDILLVGGIVQKAGLARRIFDNRYHRRVEAVATSRQTPEGLAAVLLGTEDQAIITEFLTAFQARCEFPMDELDPELDRLIEAALQISNQPNQ